MPTNNETRLKYLLALSVFAVSVGNGIAFSAPTNLTVAFIGDQGTGEDARNVLQLIVDEGADLLLIQGDLGYDQNAASRWIANSDEILGSSFPVLVTVGNHENYEWPIYKQWLTQRILDVPELICQGDPGVKAHCSFQGLSIVQVAPGVKEVDGVLPEDEYAAFLDERLATDANSWRICSWHKNQQDMQVGGKPNATGWDVYSVCRKHGAIIATAHEHSYSRTFLMSSFKKQEVVHQGDTLQIGPGQSFAFVSGLGGSGVRDQELFGDWWASVYTSTQDATHGALFCEFNDDSADCYFKDIDGTVPDRFMLVNGNAPGDTTVVENLVLSSTDDARQNMATRSGRIALLLLFILALSLFFKRLNARPLKQNINQTST